MAGPDHDARMDLRARTLVVEDEPDIRRFVRMALEFEGHEIFEGPTLQRGLIEAGSRRPELAIVDLGLPYGDGVELIRHSSCAVAAGVVTVWLWMRGLQQVPSAHAGVFTVTLPISAAAFGVLVLGEVTTAVQAVALALAPAGLLLAAWPEQ